MAVGETIGSNIAHLHCDECPTLRQRSAFIRYASMGAVGTFAHYAVLVALVHLASFAPVPASTVGAVVGALTNYILNHRFTFASQRSHVVAFPRFVVVAGLGVLVNAAVMAGVLATVTNIYLVAQVIATGAVFLSGYLANRKWTF